jgi:hypothetical protein
MVYNYLQYGNSNNEGPDYFNRRGGLRDCFRVGVVCPMEQVYSIVLCGWKYSRKPNISKTRRYAQVDYGRAERDGCRSYQPQYVGQSARKFKNCNTFSESSERKTSPYKFFRSSRRVFSEVGLGFACSYHGKMLLAGKTQDKRVSRSSAPGVHGGIAS